MTAALILTSASHTIACASCNAPWPLAVAQCPGCGRREEAHSRLATFTVPPSPDDLRAQLAAVTAERDALRAAAAEHVAATAARNDAFESARAISANSAAFAELTAAWESHAAAIGRAQNALAALRALLPTVPA